MRELRGKRAFFQQSLSSLLVFLLIFELLAGVFLFSPVLADDPHDNPSLGQNWVRDFLAQNPEYASLEITGRAESSITFKNKDGKLTTQIVGFPIHYQDKNGEWQPIDTTLVYYPNTDEWGAEGLKTRIKSDGSVRIIDENVATIHAQKSVEVGTFNQATGVFTVKKTLPAGTVVGDSIVRTVGNFTHKLTLTETGLREYLILDSALAVAIPDNIWLVIKTELASVQLFPDGWLGDTIIAGYYFPKPYGWDANGKELPLKRYARFVDGKQYVYTGILSSSLADVTYPVTIDPDYLGSTTDGRIQGSHGTNYTTARSTSSAFNTTGDTSFIGQNRFDDGEGWTEVWIIRIYLKFDTSAIPDGDTVTQVNLKMVATSDNSATDFDVNIIKQDWSAQDPLSATNREAAYDNCLTSAEDDNIWRNTSGMPLAPNVVTSGNLNTAWVSKTGSTYYSLASNRDYDGSGIDPTTNVGEVIIIALQEHATVAYRPILTVVHSSPNTAPDAPTSLAQYKSDCSTSISTGGWTSETGVCLKGYVNDTDASDQVKMQTESTTGSFTGTPNTTASAYCIDPCTSSVSVTGLSNGSQYRWQGRSIDDDSATSGFTQFNSGSLSFGVDTSSPDIVAVDAGATSTDRTSLTSNTWFKYSDTGSDDQISFSWTDPNSASNDTFYYELNADSGNTIDGTEASTTNPYIDSITVSEGTNYFHVKPKNGAGTWGTERTFTVKYDKTAPTNVGISGITANSTTQLTVTALSAADAGSGLHSTPYYFSQSSGSPNSSWQASTTWADTGLSANTQYTYIVRARDTLTNESASSTTSSKYTLASQVSSLSASNATDKSSYKINLTWTNQSQSGMKIEQDTNCDGYETTLYNNASTNATSPYEVSASAATCYQFRISSYNADGVLNTTSIPETSQITTPPAQPAGLTHTANTTSTIDWDWNDVSGATGYKVYNSSDTLLQTISEATSNWTQDSLSADAQSTVYVRATNANGEGIASSNASAYTSANIPTTASHSTNTTSSITWTWVSGGAQKDYYAWTTSPVDNSGWIAGTSWAQSSLTANSTYTFYIKARNEDLDETSSASGSAYTSQNTPTDISFDSIAADSITLSAVGTFNNLTSGSAGLYFLNTTNSATPNWLQANSWTNSSLSPNTQYTYQVKARNSDSDETSYCTATSTYTLANVPGILTFSNVSTSTLKVIIDINSNSASTNYAIYENLTAKYVNSSTGALDQDTAQWQTYLSWGSASGFTITGLSENTSYTFKAKARNGNNTETAFSSTSATTTTLSPPTAPSNANLDTITTTSMRLTWTDNASTETGFKIEQSADGGTYTQIDTALNNATSSSISSLTCNTQYYFRVRAYNTGGNSDYSTTNATTSACPASCGDGSCNGTETCSTCATDCGVCPALSGGAPGSASGNVPVPQAQTISPGGVITFIEKIPEIFASPVPKFLKPKPPEIKPLEKPTEELVAKEVPLVFQGKWQLLPTEPIREFVLAPLPKSIRNLAQKFPELEKTLEEVGVSKITDVAKLKSVKLTLPGLTERAGPEGVPPGVTLRGKLALPKGLPIAKLSSQMKQQLPTEIVFAKTGGELIDFNIDLSVTDKGEPQQKIATISGKPLQLVVKPDKPVKSVKGYVVFKSKSPKHKSRIMNQELGSIIHDSKFIIQNLTASLIFANPVFAKPQEKPVRVEERLVLLEFEYTDPDGDGIYTAEIQAPVVEGEYEIITVMDFDDPELGPEGEPSVPYGVNKKEIRLIVVVDPEGYLYEKDGDKETRIPGAIISLYWLNPETKQYEMWPAKEYQQENPQTTDVRGTYSFLVPEGYYYLKAEAPSYLVYDGKPFQVKEGSGIHINIELKTKYWWLNIVDWKTILLVVVIILLLYNFYRDKIRERLLKRQLK